MAVLSSDVLERQFGPTKLEILRQEGLDRIICTKTAGNGQVLELSRVTFRPEGITAFPGVHREVAAGTSMGKAFTQSGIPFARQIHTAYRPGQSSLMDSFNEHFGTSEPPTVIDVSIVVGAEDTPYADILEVYSPAVSWELTGSEMGQEIADRLEAFGAELAAGQ